MKSYKYLAVIFAVFVILYMILLLSSVTVFGDDDFEIDTNRSDFEIESTEESYYQLPNSDSDSVTEDKEIEKNIDEVQEQNQEEEINDNNPDIERDNETYNQLLDTVQQIQLELQELNKKNAEIIKNTLPANSDSDENKKNVTEEESETVTIEDIHYDSFKIMMCIFLALGILIGFFMISKFLI